jgi:putative DNA primase/helicase
LTIVSDTTRELDELAARRWLSVLQRSKAGEVKGNLANVITALESGPELAGIVAFDSFTRRVLLVSRPPWGARSFSRRPWRDADDSELMNWLQQNGVPVVASVTVADAIRMVAERHQFDALGQFLRGLSWDGSPRLDGWLSQYLGAEASRLTAAMGRAWLISAVARGLEPGCQADHVLVLEGPQGAGKSTAARILGGEFTQEHLPDLHSKDAAASLAGCWIVELSELAAMSRSEVESVKSFISRRVDRYRPAYGRHVVEQPRRCVFLATTNERRYLRDTSGNRRFWPVRIGAPDLDALTDAREQLLAEAVAAYEAGEPWHLTDSATIGKLSAEQAARVEADPWKAQIASRLTSREETTTRSILEWLEVDTSKQHAGHAKRVAGIMRELGWAERLDKSGGQRDVIWTPQP